MDDEFVLRSTLVFSQDPVDLVLLEPSEGRHFWPEATITCWLQWKKGGDALPQVTAVTMIMAVAC